MSSTKKRPVCFLETAGLALIFTGYEEVSNSSSKVHEGYTVSIKKN